MKIGIGIKFTAENQKLIYTIFKIVENKVWKRKSRSNIWYSDFLSMTVHTL